MQDIDDLINYIKANKGNFDRLVVNPSEPYKDMFISVDDKSYQKLMSAFPDLKPFQEDYNDVDKNGHFNINKTTLHELPDNKAQRFKEAREYYDQLDPRKDNK